MTSPALQPAPDRPSEAVTEGGASEAPRSLRALRYVDLAALALALPIFLLADFPMIGYVGAAAAWIAQRVVRELLARRAKAATDVRVAVGFTASSMIARGWFVAFSIFGIYLIGDEDAGLAAAVLILTLFTFAFTAEAVLRPFDTPAQRRGVVP